MDGQFLRGCGNPFMKELMEAFFEFLLLRPGSTLDDTQEFMYRYPAEVVDALGSDPEAACQGIADLWESVYLDPATGLEQKFSEWANSFATEEAVGIYYRLVDACRDLKRMGRELPA